MVSTRIFSFEVQNRSTTHKYLFPPCHSAIKPCLIASNKQNVDMSRHSVQHINNQTLNLKNVWFGYIDILLFSIIHPSLTIRKCYNLLCMEIARHILCESEAATNL